MVSGVATLPEFRRAGLMRAMMRLLFRDMVARGQPVAALLATQAAIYRRYGYGEAVRGARSYTIDAVDVAFADGDGGRCTVGREPMDGSLEPTLRRLYQGFAAGRAGCFDWDEGGWVRQGVKAQLRQGGRQSQPPTHCAVARDATTGEARGYCLYTLNHRVGTGAGALNRDHPTRNQLLMCSESEDTSVMNKGATYILGMLRCRPEMSAYSRKMISSFGNSFTPSGMTMPRSSA